MKKDALIRTALVGCGFAIFLAMNSFSLWGFAFLPQAAFGDAAELWSQPLAACNILAFFAFAFGSRALPRLFDRPPRVAGACLMAAGLILLVGFFSTGSHAMLAAAGALVGLGTTCCFICWELVFAESPRRERHAQILIGSVLSIVPYSLLFALPGNALFSAALLAFLNFACLFGISAHGARGAGSGLGADAAGARQAAALRDAADDAASGQEVAAGADGIVKPLLCIVMIGLVSPILGATVVETPLFVERGLLVHAANLASAVVLFALWFGLKKRVTISRTYAVVFPVLITACVLFPFLAGPYRTFALFIGSMGFSLFSIVMMMSCIEIARMRSERLVLVYGLLGGAIYASRLIGGVIAELIKASAPSADMQIALSAFVLLYGCSLVMFVVMRKNGRTAGTEATMPEEAEAIAPQMPAAARAGAEGRAEAENAGAPADAPDTLTARCRALATTCGFSERQTEVLDLLAHGYDVPAIAEKLFISENTVRTHTKKIYAAAGVHAKRELIDLVNATDPA